MKISLCFWSTFESWGINCLEGLEVKKAKPQVLPSMFLNHMTMPLTLTYVFINLCSVSLCVDINVHMSSVCDRTTFRGFSTFCWGKGSCFCYYVYSSLACPKFSRWFSCVCLPSGHGSAGITDVCHFIQLSCVFRVRNEVCQACEANIYSELCHHFVNTF